MQQDRFQVFSDGPSPSFMNMSMHPSLRRISKSELLHGFAFICIHSKLICKTLTLILIQFLSFKTYLFFCLFVFSGFFCFVFFFVCVCLGFFRLPFENGLYLFSAFTLAFFGKKPLPINQIQNTQIIKYILEIRKYRIKVIKIHSKNA